MPADPWAAFEDVRPTGPDRSRPQADQWASFEDVGPSEAAAGPQGSALGRFASGAWQNLNPVTMVKGLGQAIAHPIDTVTAAGEQMGDQWEKAYHAGAAGDYSKAAGHALAGSVPLVGPAAAQAGERIESGDVAGGLGEGVGLLGSVFAPRGVKQLKNVTPAQVGNVLKFTGKAATAVAHPGQAAAAAVVSHFVRGPFMKMVGTIMQDTLLEAINKGDLPRAARTLETIQQRYPEAAAAHAASLTEAVKQEALRVGGTAERAAVAPVAKPSTPVPSMRDTSREAIAARTADRNARQQTARARQNAPAEPAPVAAPPTVYKTPVLPTPGNVRPATVYTKPAAAPGGPPSPASQRAAALAERQRGLTSEAEIRKAFGDEPDIFKDAPAEAAPAKPAAPTQTKFHEDPAVDAQVREALPIIAETIVKGKGTKKGYIETGNHSGDLKPYGPTDTGVKAALGLDDLPESRAAIAEAIKRNKGNPLEMKVAARVAAQIEERMPAAPKQSFGRPLTAAQRKARIEELQRKLATEDDILDAFGITPF